MRTVVWFVLLTVVLVLGVPIGFGIGVVSDIILARYADPSLLLTVTAQRMYAGVASFPLLAIPFFILTGNLMNAGGMTTHLFRFAQCLVGHIKGGLGHVNVVASMIFAGMSGSAVADAAGLGVVEINAMRRAGYDLRFGAAVTAASSTIGPIIPPSIPFVIFGGMTGVSVGRLFLGGFVPGLLMGFALMVVVYLVAKRRGYPCEPRATAAEILQTALGASPSLLVPVIILGGIVGGIFTPTEAAIVASAYAVLLGLLTRAFDLRGLVRVFQETVEFTAKVMFIIAVAALFGWVLAYEGTSEVVVRGFSYLSTNPLVILIAINALLLFLGCFMESISVIVLMTPILMPLVQRLGLDPVHFGVVMTLNLMIGLLTPPFGMSLYCVLGITNLQFGELVRELVPYIVILIVVLALITVFPSLVVFVPNAVMGKG